MLARRASSGLGGGVVLEGRLGASALASTSGLLAAFTDEAASLSARMVCGVLSVAAAGLMLAVLAAVTVVVVASATACSVGAV
jgi:hypothetical protein